MALHKLTIAGFILVNIGFWPVFIALARRGGLGSSFSSMGAAVAAFRAPAPGLETLVLWGGPPLILLGALLAFSGVFAADAGDRAACRSACAERGFEDGLMRGDPHAERPGETPRQCWCYNGAGSDQTWASEGLDLPTSP